MGTPVQLTTKLKEGAGDLLQRTHTPVKEGEAALRP